MGKVGKKCLALFLYTSTPFQTPRNYMQHTGKMQNNSEEDYAAADSAYIGLAPPGEIGSWQREGKGYQFWTIADDEGSFCTSNILPGEYNLFAWIPGFIGDYRYSSNLMIEPGSDIDLGDLVYEPSRDGSIIWEIGIPDRSAQEFYIPEPNPKFNNRLFAENHLNCSSSVDKYRQYGLWERYTELYPDSDLIYTVGTSDYTKDWFFAQFTRFKEDGTFQATTWQIKFTLDKLDEPGTYKVRLALASATDAELQIKVRFNDENVFPPHFTTGLIGKDNAMARHGIHGLYWMYDINVPFNDENVFPPHLTTGLIDKDNSMARHGIHGLYWMGSCMIISA
ncbi:hypothetical protein C5167_042117 [Papaver somniferum]|nr:hypothetical protein C5167_042117 [Papaver somniferum]